MGLVAKNRLEQHYIYKSYRCVRGVPNRQPGRYCKLPLRVPFKGQLQTGSRATLISFKLPTAPPLATPAKENTSRIQERMRNGSSGRRGSLPEFSASLQQSPRLLLLSDEEPDAATPPNQQSSVAYHLLGDQGEPVARNVGSGIRRARHWVTGLSRRCPDLFAHWQVARNTAP